MRITSTVYHAILIDLSVSKVVLGSLWIILTYFAIFRELIWDTFSLVG